MLIFERVSCFKQIWAKSVCQFTSVCIWVSSSRSRDGDLWGLSLVCSARYCPKWWRGSFHAPAIKAVWCRLPPGKRMWSWQDSCLPLRQSSKMLTAEGWQLVAAPVTEEHIPFVLKGDMDSVPHRYVHLVRSWALSLGENVLISYYGKQIVRKCSVYWPSCENKVVLSKILEAPPLWGTWWVIIYNVSQQKYGVRRIFY